VVIFKTDDWQPSIQRILQQFDDSIGGYYRDHIGSVITVADREGRERQYARMTLSVGAVTVKPSDLHCPIDLSEAAAIAKHHAKSMRGSSLYIYELEPALPKEWIEGGKSNTIITA
jgi:hypothetical protein